MLSMTLVLGAILPSLSVMSSLSRSSEQPLRTRDPYLRSDRRELAFDARASGSLSQRLEYQ